MKLLHYGCGGDYHEGFINSDFVDKSKQGREYKLDDFLDLSRVFHYDSYSVDGIVSMGTLQQLHWRDLVNTLRESHRVLKNGGIFRMGVPVVEKGNSIDFLLGWNNINLFSWDVLSHVLEEIGFIKVCNMNYGDSRLPKLAEVDNKAEQFFYIEAEKSDSNIVEDLQNTRFNKRYRIWKPFMEKHKCERICEVGVRQGENFLKMIKHNPEDAVAVDLWRKDGLMSHNDKDYSQEQLDEQYKKFKGMVKGLKNVTIHRDYSKRVSGLYPYDYFDLIYLDADHTYEGVTEDIEAWYPKVRIGGFLLGDDFVDRTTRTGVKFGVVSAVRDFAKKNNLEYFEFPKHKWGIIKK